MSLSPHAHHTFHIFLDELAKAHRKTQEALGSFDRFHFHPLEKLRLQRERERQQAIIDAIALSRVLGAALSRVSLISGGRRTE